MRNYVSNLSISEVILLTNIVEIEEKIELLRATLYELVQQNSSDKKILHISQSLDKLLNEYDKKKALKE